MKRSHLVTTFVGLLAIVGLVLAGNGLRSRGAIRCELDQGDIHGYGHVHVVDQEGQTHAFCCIRCAKIWLAQQTDAPRRILVTDESSGIEIDAALAVFVRSAVVTNRTTGNRVHAFRDRVQAQKHALQCRGAILEDAERPF